MTWVVKRTDTFLDSLKAIRKNKEALAELDKKIKRLQEDPLHLGGLFTPNETEKVVYLNWIDHRKTAYD